MADSFCFLAYHKSDNTHNVCVAVRVKSPKLILSVPLQAKMATTQQYLFFRYLWHTRVKFAVWFPAVFVSLHIQMEEDALKPAYGLCKTQS